MLAADAAERGVYPAEDDVPETLLHLLIRTLLWELTRKHLHLAVEIVSDDAYQDYELGPMRYDELGVDELVIVDPLWHVSPGRVRWQVYRRGPAGLAQVARQDGDRVQSEVLGCGRSAAAAGFRRCEQTSRPCAR